MSIVDCLACPEELLVPQEGSQSPPTMSFVEPEPLGQDALHIRSKSMIISRACALIMVHACTWTIRCACTRITYFEHNTCMHFALVHAYTLMIEHTCTLVVVHLRDKSMEAFM